MTNSTNFSEVSKQSTNFSQIQLTSGSESEYDNSSDYDSDNFYDGIVVLSATEDGSTNFAGVTVNSTNFSTP